MEASHMSCREVDMVISEVGVKLDVLTSGDAVPEGRTGTKTRQPRRIPG
jgi:hypothetical protein